MGQKELSTIHQQYSKDFKKKSLCKDPKSLTSIKIIKSFLTDNEFDI